MPQSILTNGDREVPLVSGRFELRHKDNDSEITVVATAIADTPEEVIYSIRERMQSLASWIENAYDIEVDTADNAGDTDFSTTIFPVVED